MKRQYFQAFNKTRYGLRNEEYKGYVQAGKTYESENSFLLFCSLKELLNWTNLISTTEVHEVIPLDKVIEDAIMGVNKCYKIKIGKKVAIKKELFSNIKTAYKSSSYFESDGLYHSEFINNSNAVAFSSNIVNSHAIRKSGMIENSKALEYCYSVRNSEAMSNSSKCINSQAICRSDFIYNSRAICDSKGIIYSQAIDKSVGVAYSYRISKGYFIEDCSNSENLLFCFGINNKSYMLFNKKISEERFFQIISKLKDYYFEKDKDIAPHFVEIKEERLQKNSFREAYSEHIETLKEFYKELANMPEFFSFKILERITGIEYKELKKAINS